MSVCLNVEAGDATAAVDRACRLVAAQLPDLPITAVEAKTAEELERKLGTMPAVR